MAHWLFLPNEALKDLETLASLPREKIVKFRDILNSTDRRPRYAFYVKTAELLGISDETAASLCTFASYVQTQRRKAEKPATAVPDELERFLKTTASEDAAKAERLAKFVRENRDLLSAIFSDLPVYDLSAKVLDLETGPLPHLKSFRAFCDLRPVYDTEGGKIVSCFPLITLSLTTHSSESDQTKEVVVQLTESDIKDVQKQFARLERKLAELKARYLSSRPQEEKE